MLTLQETITAIKALDTEPDIIRNACDKVLFPKKTDIADLDSRDIALEICNKYSKVHDTSQVLLGVCMAAATLAAAVCKPGKESELMRTIHAMIIDQFAEVTSKKLMRRFATDPEAVSKHLLEILEQTRKK